MAQGLVGMDLSRKQTAGGKNRGRKDSQIVLRLHHTGSVSIRVGPKLKWSHAVIVALASTPLPDSFRWNQANEHFPVRLVRDTNREHI